MPSSSEDAAEASESVAESDEDDRDWSTGSGETTDTDEASESDPGTESDEEKYVRALKMVTKAVEKGVELRKRDFGRRYERRHREMVWNTIDGYWRGAWQWTPWEDEEQQERRAEVHPSRVHAVREWDAANIPQEILLLIVKYVAGVRRSSVRKLDDGVPHYTAIDRTSGSGNLALVCRAWYAITSPALYSMLVLTDAFDPSTIRPSTMEHVRSIAIQNAWPSLSALPRFYPSLRSNLRSLWYEEPQRKSGQQAAAAYNPSQLAVHLRANGSLAGLVDLNLLRSQFHSSSDLLRLLAFLPTVVRVDLKRVRVARVSDSVTIRPGKQARRLQSVRTDENCSPPGLAFVVQSLAWQVLQLPEQRVFSFCGLSRAEQALVGRTSERLGQKGFALVMYHNNVMDRNGEACE